MLKLFAEATLFCVIAPFCRRNTAAAYTYLHKMMISRFPLPRFSDIAGPTRHGLPFAIFASADADQQAVCRYFLHRTSADVAMNVTRAWPRYQGDKQDQAFSQSVSRRFAEPCPGHRL